MVLVEKHKRNLKLQHSDDGHFGSLLNWEPNRERVKMTECLLPREASIDFNFMCWSLSFLFFPSLFVAKSQKASGKSPIFGGTEKQLPLERLKKR